MKHKFFEAARAVALSSQGKHRLGAVVVKNGRVVAARCNNYLKTHPALAKFTEFPYLHAETAAVIAAGAFAAKGSEVYVCRLDMAGRKQMSKPCKDVCQPFLKEAGVLRAFFTIDGCSFGVLEIGK